MLGTFVILDERFPRLVPAVGGAEVLHDGGTFTEGPVWFADHQCLLWSDIPANRIMRLTMDGQVSVFRADSGHTNGNTRDREGRLVSCEHRTRRVTRTELDGTITVLADSFEGKPLNSPNDVVVQLGRLDLVHRSRLWAAVPCPGRRQAIRRTTMSSASIQRAVR